MGSMPVNFSQRFKKKVPESSPVAMANAQAWNKPGGGYERFKQGDAQREQETAAGDMSNHVNSTPAPIDSALRWQHDRDRYKGQADSPNDAMTKGVYPDPEAKLSRPSVPDAQFGKDLIAMTGKDKLKKAMSSQY